MNAQLDSARDRFEIQPNLGVVLMTQLKSVGTTIGRHANESIQLNST
jgi:hypothetical protein